MDRRIKFWSKTLYRKITTHVTLCTFTVNISIWQLQVVRNRINYGYFGNFAYWVRIF